MPGPGVGTALALTAALVPTGVAGGGGALEPHEIATTAMTATVARRDMGISPTIVPRRAARDGER